MIDGAIGEESPFHEEFGCYAHGVGPETAVLPRGWRRRAVRLRTKATHGVTAICPAPADLAVSKLAAGRPKDLEFVRALVRHGLVARESIVQAATELPEQHRGRVEDLLGLVR